MSMSEEERNPSTKPNASGSQEQNPAGQNSAEQQETGLPGLASFGGMQGYAPVTGQPQAGEPAADSMPEPELQAGIQEETAADAPGQEQYHHSEYAEAQYTDAAIPETGAEASAEPPYVSADEPYAQDDVQEYVSEQDHALGLQQDAAPYDDAGLHGDEGLHGDTSTSLQTFEAHYDQHPEIPLDAFEDPGQEQAAQPFFHETGQAGDADFLGGEFAADEAEPKERRGRKILMASSGLIGVLALGGALAFAYKIGGESDIASAGKPPLIQADSRPVKLAPDKPGGKQFPHKNKKIYERLQGSNSDEVERIVPRQEDVAAATTAAINGAKPAPGGAKTVLAPKTDANSPGAPRKVKTLTVRPDGTMEATAPRQKIVKAPPAPAAAPKFSGDGGTGIALSIPQPAASTPPAAAPAPAAKTPVKPDIPKPAAATPPPAAPQKVAAASSPAVSAPPHPVQKPPAPRAAAPAPAPRKKASLPAAAPAVSGSEYMVQVAARKSQMEALASFADMRQKYPRLLSGYRPIVKRTDLGNKGVWYRLNVGPVKSKKVASSLCGQLKSAGMRSCIVRAQ